MISIQRLEKEKEEREKLERSLFQPTVVHQKAPTGM
jgi:hypothetical protein